MPDADLGNPGSWWRPYIGKYELTPSEGVSVDSTVIMLSTILDVMFTSDIEVNGQDGVLALLPEECRPSGDVRFNAFLTAANSDYLACIMVNSDGELHVEGVMRPTAVGTLVLSPLVPDKYLLKLNGTSFNITNRYYREEV